MTHDDVKRCIGLKAAAALLRGRGGKPPSLDTVRRWANPRRGYRPRGNYAGPPLVLATCRLGNDLVTLPEWVEEFERRRFQMGTTRVMPTRTPRQAAAALRRAEEYLDAQGVK